jgi:hypothetical protein
MADHSKGSPSGDLLSVIPDPQTIRTHLARNLREADLLRSLLRLALRASDLANDLRSREVRL